MTMGQFYDGRLGEAVPVVGFSQGSGRRLGTERRMGVSVLLVEDNELNRDMLERRLRRRGYDVLFAFDGAEGVEMALAHLPDVVLMDMSLPVLDGWGATRKLRELEATRPLPIIALTAHAMAGDRDAALQAGCNDYESKPIDIDRLVGKIEALLQACSNG